MKRVEFQWKRGVFEQIRRLPAIEKGLKKTADAVAADAGAGYESSLGDGRTRSRASVVTASADAMRAESKSSNLLRALANRRV